MQLEGGEAGVELGVQGGEGEGGEGVEGEEVGDCVDFIAGDEVGLGVGAEGGDVAGWGMSVEGNMNGRGEGRQTAGVDVADDPVDGLGFKGAYLDDARLGLFKLSGKGLFEPNAPRAENVFVEAPCPVFALDGDVGKEAGFEESARHDMVSAFHGPARHHGAP